MTEYRVVATLDVVHDYNGEKFHYDIASCHWGGKVHKMQTYDKDRAEYYLKRAKEECPKFDVKTQENTSRDYIRYLHSNIRIQTREVTEWSD